MAEIAECPQCRRQLRVPEELVGRAVKCPACSLTFTAGTAPPESVRPDAPLPFREEPPPPPPETPYQEEPPRRYRRDLAPHRGGMILTFGILSLVCGCLSLIFGPMAWIMGSNDLTEIRQGRMDPEGEGMTRAGQVCGIVGTSLGFLGLCCGGLQVLLEAANQ